MNNLYAPEKLSTWDRWFNRYKKIPVDSGSETWQEQYAYNGVRIGNIQKYSRQYVTYHVVDRLTGGYTINKEYLN